MVKYLKEYDNLNKDSLIKYFNEKIVNDYDPEWVGEENVITRDMWLEIMTVENIEKKLIDFSNEYIDEDLDKYLMDEDPIEIMIKCDKYYYISIEYKEQVIEKIKKWSKIRINNEN